jgi:ligand-binding SRPBCC domain-containing protein
MTKTHTLKRTQSFNKPIEEVFRFFQSPENLARITPSRLNFRLLTPSPITMKEGALIDYTIAWLGVPVRWTTMITHYEPPYKFVDQQIKGPYSLWHHTHIFVEHDGTTEMTDEVRYVLPFGFLGDVAHALVVQRQLNDIFDYRARVIGEIFSANDSRFDATLTKEMAV